MFIYPHVKYTLFLSNFNEITQKLYFKKIRPVTAEFFHMDRHD